MLLLAMVGCGMRRELQRAQALESVGQWEQAYAAYSPLFEHRPQDAAVRGGYERAAQGVLDQRLSAAIAHYRAGAIEAGDAELERASRFRRQAVAQGIHLRWDPAADAARSDARQARAADLYEQAEAAFREERFGEAQALAEQCQRLDQSHSRAAHLARLAQTEPLYREGQRAESLGLWRQAYHRYKDAAAIDPGHKDVLACMVRCREKAAYTLAVLVSSEGNALDEAWGMLFGSKSDRLMQEMSALVHGEILALKDPFLQLIDRANTEAILAEQRRQMSGSYGEQVALAGKLLGASYIMTVRMLRTDPQSRIEAQVQLLDAQSGRIHISDMVRATRGELARRGQQVAELAAHRIAERLRGFDPAR
ncbi:MAG: hypothetical protein ACK4L7_01780 [Flavobacteriales bacterium]